MKRFDLSLYLVLDPDLCAGYGMVETARAAVEGGTTIVQLRDKTGGTERLVETGLTLKRALAGTGALLIVNDDIEAACRIGADGLHIGQDDGDPALARKQIGKKMILGVSVETLEATRRLDPGIVDYVGVGPVFATATKPDHKQPVGFDGLAALVAASPVPSVAIGGLKGSHVKAVLDAGADGLAVVSAICGTPDPREAARALAILIKEARR
ncbi:thiamine-phosphate pyrophosphorylase [Pararhizobium capsulatum DSM 1112]|uniref:Thiamine-phosphate synthase n=1 Tax=Pararhizobium capsulatum DSM 1112 TaxID=1121113 RepID=A0ABU0BKQ6_9HYPH|nr:thiamine phosphate synthase [Pararhizobium capsulatum]MDQ0318587.1 thiamine-phosphate pyrophosphorylase [Pararhizobium capsulatum DSM 1112]